MSDTTPADELAAAKRYFDRTIGCLTEEDSEFRPVEGTYTVAQQVAHAAQTVDWFMQGAFRPEAFDLDFERLNAEIAAVRSFGEARAWLDRAFAAVVAKIGGLSAVELAEPLPDNPIMQGPRSSIIGSIVDHTAHHRGSLAVYARLLGRVPAMPYMEEEAPVAV